MLLERRREDNPAVAGGAKEEGRFARHCEM